MRLSAKFHLLSHQQVDQCKLVWSTESADSNLEMLNLIYKSFKSRFSDW